MKNLGTLLVAGFAWLILATPSALAQEWSAAQKEVWSQVQARWELGAKQDLEGVMGCFHPDYSGWGNDEPLPNDKAAVRKWIEQDFKSRKTLVYDIKPVAIKLHGNTAIVHYCHSSLIKGSDGREKTETGRWTARWPCWMRCTRNWKPPAPWCKPPGGIAS